MNRTHETFDEALQMLAAYGPETVEGFSNHGPMAAEALCAIGRADLLVPWVERYRKRLQPKPKPESIIIESQWPAALGHYRRFPEWAEFFHTQLKNASWRDVLDRWVIRLAPGIAAAAFHGVLRTAHAVRSLGEGETPLRLAELAQGLGYWAATYQPLDARPSKARGVKPSEAIAKVPLLPESKRMTGGAITDALGPDTDYPPFGDVYGLIDTSGDIGALISDLTSVFARIYATNATGISSTIAFIHCVTGPSCVRLMLPYIREEPARACVAHAWNAAAAIYSAYGMKPPIRATETASTPQTNGLIDTAVANGDEHAIKFSDACIREWLLNRDGAYLDACAHALTILPPAR